MSSSVGWAMALRPLALVLILAAIYPVRLLVERRMKPGKLKSILLRRVGG